MNDDERRRAIDYISSYIRREVASGFADPERIVPNALEIVSDECPPDELRPHAERLLRKALAAKVKEEQSWPAVTDCDRFDAAFADLERAGIVCRHDFACCGTCAAAEIWGEIEAERARGREVIGCAHYHHQDTERAIEGYGLYLSYCSVLRGDRPSVDIGRKIARAMRSHGLKVTWNGSVSNGIHVALDWKRRSARAVGHPRS
jgi:hypothetical protein